MTKHSRDNHTGSNRRDRNPEPYSGATGRADEPDGFAATLAGWNANRTRKQADYRTTDHGRFQDAQSRGGRSAAGTLALVGLLGAAAYAAAPHVRRLLAEQGIGKDGSNGESAKDVGASITIARPASELYDRWRGYERFDQFMPDVISVQAIDDGQESDWTIRAPGGQELQFRACLTEDLPNQTIAWASDDQPARHSGRVTFTERGEDSTEVRLELHMEPPGGALGAIVARLLGKASGTDPQMQAERALRNLKRVMERDGTGSTSRAAWQSGVQPAARSDDDLESQPGATPAGGVNGSSGQPYTA